MSCSRLMSNGMDEKLVLIGLASYPCRSGKGPHSLGMRLYYNNYYDWPYILKAILSPSPWVQHYNNIISGS